VITPSTNTGGTLPRDRYDVVVVGARCAGAATAMLAARQGLRVLVLDKTTQGSDTLSTHALMRPAVAQLQRWGVLDRIVEAATPAITTTTFHYGESSVPIAIKPDAGVDALYAPRRTLLDSLLVDAARAAGVEFRFGVTVTGVHRDGRGRVRGVTGRTHDGRKVEVGGDVTIGADGMRSRLARLLSAPTTHAAGHTTATIYSYIGGIEAQGYEWYFRAGGAAGSIPTDDGDSCVFVTTTPQRFRAELRADVRGGFRRLLAEVAPDLAERVAAVPGPARYRSWEGMPGYLRKPFGPGWALVGDAGYFKDPITAHGITDAFRDADLLSRAVVAAAGGAPEALAYGCYEQVRDELSLPLLRVSDRIASFAWGLDEVMGLHKELSTAMNAEGDMLAGLDRPVLAA